MWISPQLRKDSFTFTPETFYAQKYFFIKKQLERYLWDNTFNTKLSVESKHEKAEY